MTQAQLDAVQFSLSLDYFKDIDCQFTKNKIICDLGENIHLIVKRTKKETYISLQKGTSSIKFPSDIFNLICDSKVSISFLKSYLEEQPIRVEKQTQTTTE